MHTILITGVGAIIGYGLVRAARHARYPLRIVGMDTNTDAIGQQWCDEFFPTVPAAASEYPELLREQILHRRIDLVLPGVEYDVNRLSQDWSLFQDLPARFVLNSAALVRTASDKWLTHQALVEAGLPTIPTRPGGSFADLVRDLGLPFLFKPRRSSASKGIQVIAGEAEYLFYRERYPDNFIVQEIVGNNSEEYTAGLFGYGDGSHSHLLVMQRRLSREGATAKACTVFLPELDQFIEQLVRLFRPLGPTNFQFRRQQGQFLLLEVNPRCSSSESLRTAFGINDVELCVEYYLLNQRPVPRTIRPGRAQRFIDDLVWYDDCPAL